MCVCVRWKCYEVHDIVLECSRVSLDPLESSCEDDTFSSLRDPPPPPPSPSFPSSTSSSPAPRGPPPAALPHLNLNLSPGASVCRFVAQMRHFFFIVIFLKVYEQKCCRSEALLSWLCCVVHCTTAGSSLDPLLAEGQLTANSSLIQV